jgi:RNA polymerase sigma-70 factor (ECF subfamily)
MNELTQESDESLLRRCSRGDEEAFTALYRRRQGGVYRFALHMSGRADVAEEVTQEVFLTLIREPGRFSADKGTVVSYLYGIARNHVLRQMERGRREMAVDDADCAETATNERDVLGQLTREEAIEAVRHAVLTLPAVYREALVLCELEEMQYADAATVLGVPVGTVRSRLNRGRGMLLEKLRSRNVARCSV